MEVVVIEFDGDIDDFPVLVQTIEGLIEGGSRHVVLGLDSLPLINSAALGYLVSAQKRMQDEGGQIVLTGLKPAMKNILDMTNLDLVFPAFDTQDEAVDFVGSGEASPTDDQVVRREAWRPA